jgi:Holliday junction resolvasome RuvABC endonuclease subunit
MTARFSLGFDPGWKNLGGALVKQVEGKLSLVSSQALNPSSYKPGEMISGMVGEFWTQSPTLLDYVSIERYVSYKNVLTPESEHILMLIGGLREFCYDFVADSGRVQLFRAIDWKTELVKTLVKLKQFDNPSQSLDKKFSIAAAKACLDEPTEIQTDHEADAICLACLPFLRERLKQSK